MISLAFTGTLDVRVISTGLLVQTHNLLGIYL